MVTSFTVDILWGQSNHTRISLILVCLGQLIKLAQVAPPSELLENHHNNIFFFEIVPCRFYGASEIQT